MTIQYYTKNVYGNELIYVKDKMLALYISNLIGKKTIDKFDIINFKKLGLKFERVIE